MNEIDAVKHLGDQIGYGNLMSIASALWRKNLKETDVPEHGAFVPTIIDFIQTKYKKLVEDEVRISNVRIKSHFNDT